MKHKESAITIGKFIPFTLHQGSEIYYPFTSSVLSPPTPNPNIPPQDSAALHTSSRGTTCIPAGQRLLGVPD